MPARKGARPHPGDDGAFGDGQLLVGDDDFGVDLELESQPGAGWASPMGTVEAEGPGLYLRQADAAVDAGEVFGKDLLFSTIDGRLDDAITLLQGCFHRVGHTAGLGIGVQHEPVHHDLDVVPFLLVQIEVPHALQLVYYAVDSYSNEAGPSGFFEHRPCALPCADAP